MAIYDFDTLHGTTIAFDPAIDTLDFRFASAAQLRFVVAGPDLQVLAGDRWVVLAGISYASLDSGAMTFADGSLFRTGTAAGQQILGGTGDDFLDGRAGADTLAGGAGSDTYVIDSGGDQVLEAAGEGTDQVRSIVSHALGANVEQLWLRGTAAINGYGNGLDNVLFSGDGNNVLNGGSGTDTVSYRYALAGVSVSLGSTLAQATGGSGSDTLANFENLTGSESSDTLRGNNNGNRIEGLAGNDQLDGGAGADTLHGGLGSDTYLVDDAGDVVVEEIGGAPGGTDLVQSTLAAWTLGHAIEQLRIVSAGAANGTGNALDNVIHAGAGDNVMNGGAGNDTASFVYAGGGVTINLGLPSAQATGGSGSDTLLNFEHVVGSNSADRLTGNSFNNILNGAGGNDTLRGGAGNDTLVGGLGNDTFHVDAAGDVVSEGVGGGIDLVETIADHTLGAHVENARVLGYSAVRVTGNALDNVLYAGLGSATLDGGAGIDTLDLAAQGSLYYGGSVRLDEGYALVGSGSHVTLAGFENVAGSSNGDFLRGDAGANVIDGRDGADRLDGGAGIDTLIGGNGSDYYRIDDDTDVVIELGTGPGDRDVAELYRASYTIGAGIEDVRVYTGAAVTVIGNAAGNVITLGAGAASVDGGAGIDTLRLDETGWAAGVVLDMVLGTTVLNGNAIDFTSIERFVGTRQDDSLYGDDAGNYLDGEAGNDRLEGRAGNDTLFGDYADDVLVGGAGADLLIGGFGANRYVFEALSDSTVAAMDTIRNFDVHDGGVIDLSAIDANVNADGDQAFAFIGTAAFSASATGQLRYDAATKTLYASVDSDADAEFAVRFEYVSSTFTANDFLL